MGVLKLPSLTVDKLAKLEKILVRSNSYYLYLNQFEFLLIQDFLFLIVQLTASSGDCIGIVPNPI